MEINVSIQFIDDDWGYGVDGGALSIVPAVIDALLELERQTLGAIHWHTRLEVFRRS
jgi:hypothetical protein